MKEQTKIGWWQLSKIRNKFNTKNNHNSLPALYPSRQTHTFNLDDGHLNGLSDGQTATTPAHALGYIMLFIGYFTCLKGTL